MENFTITSTAAFGAPSTLLCAAPRPRLGRHVGATGVIAPVGSIAGGTRLSVAVDVTQMNAKQGSPPRGAPR